MFILMFNIAKNYVALKFILQKYIAICSPYTIKYYF